MSFVTTINPNYYLKLSDLPHRKLSDFNIPLKELKATLYTCDWDTYLNVNAKLSDYGEVSFVRNFDININMQNSVAKTLTKNSPIIMNVSTSRNANAGQVIGDIRFYDTVLNETNYDSTLTPYGYGKWKELITGDYIYTKAMCKYSMQASLNADRPNTRQYLHKVDVPDVVDRGIAELTKENQPLFVKFSKEEVRKFHIVPELNVSIKSYSGTDKSPIIIPYNTTTEGFYVTMKADGEFVEGKISWSARGY